MQAAPEALTIRDGLVFPVLGQPCRISLLAGANRAHWVEGFAERELRLLLRRQEDAPTLLLRGLERYGLQYFLGGVGGVVYVLGPSAPGGPLPRCWAVEETILPAYEVAKAALRQAHRVIPSF